MPATTYEAFVTMLTGRAIHELSPAELAECQRLYDGRTVIEPGNDAAFDRGLAKATAHSESKKRR